MKNIFFILLFSIISIQSYSQISLTDVGGEDITNQSRLLTPDAEYYINISNAGTSAIDITVEVIELSVPVSDPQNFFQICYNGNCYSPSLTGSIGSGFNLEAGTTSPMHFFDVVYNNYANISDAAVIQIKFFETSNSSNSASIRLANTFTNVTQLTPEMNWIYPNPASDFIHFKSYGSEGSLILTDINGIRVKNFKVSETNNTLAMSDIAEGIYFYTYICENRKPVSGKLVIVR